MPLAAPRGGLVATDATEMIITEPDVAIDYRLSLAQVIRPALQPLLPNPDLPPLAVCDGLPCRLGVLVLDGQGAGRRAHALAKALRDELGAALGVLALLGFGWRAEGSFGTIRAHLLPIHPESRSDTPAWNTEILQAGSVVSVQPHSTASARTSVLSRSLRMAAFKNMQRKKPRQMPIKVFTPSPPSLLCPSRKEARE